MNAHTTKPRMNAHVTPIETATLCMVACAAINTAAQQNLSCDKNSTWQQGKPMILRPQSLT